MPFGPVRVPNRGEGRIPWERDVVCGMQVDPAKAAGSSEYSGKDVLLLIERLQSQVRREPLPIREVG